MPAKDACGANRIAPNCRVVAVPDEPGKGYLDQQSTKMHADMYTAADYVLFTDSDTVFSRPTTPDSTRSDDGRIVHLMTPWEHVGDAICWKPAIKKALGYVGDYEMMRRLPFVFPREVLRECRKDIETLHGMDLRQYILGCDTFSEFNVLGTWAFRNAYTHFDFQDTTKLKELPPLVSRQFWSWGGITPEVQKEIETMVP